MLVEETTIPSQALPVTTFREHLRLGTGFGEDSLQDSLIEGFLRAAIAAIEVRTSKVLLSRDFVWTRLDWSTADRQPLPVAPVREVTSIVIRDATDRETELPESSWRFMPDMQRPLVICMSGIFPTVPQGGAVVLRFNAGFGPDWADLPHDLAQAVFMLAAHYYDYRHDTALGANCTPFGVSALIERWRSVRLFGRGDL